MKFLSVFLVLTFLWMSATLVTDAVWDGPYYAYADVYTTGNTIIGNTKARGTGSGRNASYMCSIGMEVTPVSGSNINGSFSDGVNHSRSRGAIMYADSSSWGSDNNNGTWHASDSDSDQ